MMIEMVERVWAGRRVFIPAGDGDAAAVRRHVASLGAEVVDDGPFDVLVESVWTSPVASQVVGARAAGARITTLAELVLESTGARILAVTGTAGKTSTTRLAAHLMRAGGLGVVMGETGRAAQAWPDAAVLAAAPALSADDWIALELTSSHLAFMAPCAPDVAVVTNFWPDHGELHGSIAAYLEAKLGMVMGQLPSDRLVIDPVDESLDPFRQASGARIVAVEGGSVAVHDGQVVWLGDTVICSVEVLPSGPYRHNALLAIGAALAAGADVDGVRAGIAVPPDIPHRLTLLGRRDGVSIYDDTTAATPAKAMAALRALDEERVVWVVGGRLDLGTGRVHASVAESALVAEACAVGRERCAAIVRFAEAGETLDLPGPLVPTVQAAVESALALAPSGGAVVVSPMFPLVQADRDWVASCLDR